MKHEEEMLGQLLGRIVMPTLIMEEFDDYSNEKSKEMKKEKLFNEECVLDTFGTLLGHFWDTFGTLLGHLGHFWDTFGTLLGHFWETWETFV